MKGFNIFVQFNYKVYGLVKYLHAMKPFIMVSTPILLAKDFVCINFAENFNAFTSAKHTER